jgi:hypothetical protein
MAIQIAPIAGLVLRYGAVACAAYVASRAVDEGRLAQPVEDEMDSTPDGVAMRRQNEQVNGSARWRRTIRLGERGPGVSVDATFLGRIRVGRT